MQNSIPGLSFNYVPGSDNPADFATRGMSFVELQSELLWWFGPEWLHQERLPEWNLPPVTKDLLSQIETELKKSAKP